MSPSELVAADLAAGRRIDAAFAARVAAENASAEELRELVNILADYVEALGDRLPAHNPEGHRSLCSPEGMATFARRSRLSATKRKLRALLICRDLVDGRHIGPRSLSELLSYLRVRLKDDPADLRGDDLIRHRAARLAADPVLTMQLVEELKPRALAELKAWELEPAKVKRQGIRGTYRWKVADACGVKEKDLESVTVKTSE